MQVRTGECNQCGECCQTVNVTAVRDRTLQQHGNRRELELYLGYRGIRVAGEDVENNLLFYTLEIPCSQLGPDNECRVHNSPRKPLICYRYPEEKDDVEECSYRFEPSVFLKKED
jgi:Fe-S-cluster containining protein